MLQIVYTVASAAEDGSYNPGNPVALTTLPVTGGAAVLTAGPYNLAENPVDVAALGPRLVDTTGNPSALIEPPWVLSDTGSARMYSDTPQYEKIVFAFPLGEDDWLIASRSRVGRVTGGVRVWSHAVFTVGGSGINFMFCAVAKRGGSYYLFARSNPNDAFSAGTTYYTAVDISGVTPPGVVTSWASVAVNGAASSLGIYGHEAVAVVLPDFELAMIGDTMYSGDGVTVLNRAVITGPAQDVFGGKEVAGFGIGESFDDGFQRFFAPFIATVSLSSGQITDYTRAYAAPTYTQSAIQSLVPPGTEANIEYGGAFVLLGDPPPVPPFWTSLRRAIETI
ncbi:hypothetical protein [Pseudomonas anguilliseptica]|uniref:hypothetical protein n=1 Tax=Pseudomonas anguilliseptica TaxID=53406 RepID=UPI0022AF1B8D|nr:hypothetical protein [Pseudomonas anguilliseptica]MCZ4321466.1 hypothetical protein [Pseudomonas anguilliseptica]